MGRLFGTDGVRGIANSELTCEMAMNIGRAAAMVLTDGNHRHPKILIGKDTRLSSDMLENALTAGLCSVGANVVQLGVVPTPAVAYLVGKYKADAGVMLTASHNPCEFNGIKIFSGDGYKLPDALEEQIEAIVLDHAQKPSCPTGGDVGSVSSAQNTVRDYVDHIKSTVAFSLDGMNIGIDCANGAACRTAEKLFTELGATCHMNAANILKPALSRGEIQVIGATTFVEYRKYIEKDAALERRFQPVTIAEPSIDETVDVLMGIKSYYESYHRVRVPEEIVKKAVVLSERYINDRFLPDKAIDLLDESCACAALRNISMADYDSVNFELEERKNQEEELTADGIEPDYEKLAEVRTEISRLEKKTKELAPLALGAPVEEKDIAKVIELWTGIPASRIQENELRKLADIENTLNSKVIGQAEAVKAVSAAIRRSRVQISPRRRPASFIFVGPTGVGKTELVKVLSKELFDTPETLIRLDMSEFMEKHSVSRIIGSPPGYVGYDEAGQVTEKVRRRPYSVLLFDEIEKAHPDVMNILLQILDEGRITDAHGRTVNFENTVLVMTSNAGSEKKEGTLGFAKNETDVTREKAMKALAEFLRPEFLSRVDEIIVFRSLNTGDFEAVSRLMLDEYVGSLKERGIRLIYDDQATHYLAEHAIGGKSGARDLRNLIRRQVEDKIASLIVENYGETITGISVTADEKDGIKLDILK